LRAASVVPFLMANHIVIENHKSQGNHRKPALAAFAAAHWVVQKEQPDRIRQPESRYTKVS